ncbi:DUF768 domain-containing protein (plasmid) [Mesorhizobium sp. INR15]|nr:DUF768 domain-containing protein [Mesorhizobium sp. INR15]
MSTRGTNFVDQWIRSKVPRTVGADVISVAELAEALFDDACVVGIDSTEIEEDVGSLYQMIFDATCTAMRAWPIERTYQGDLYWRVCRRLV